MTWRDEQAAQTRTRIIDGFLELSRGPEAKRVTTAAVSRHTGVSPATIYRHFPDRDALVAAAAHRDIRVGVEDVEAPGSLADFRRHLEVLWTDLADNLPVTREGAVSEAGRELRAARYESSLRPVREALCRLTDDEPTVDRLCAVGMLLSSVHAFLDLHDRQGLAPADAAEVAMWAFEELIRAVTGSDEPLRYEPRPDEGER